jgi:hypothetical protein
MHRFIKDHSLRFAVCRESTGSVIDVVDSLVKVRQVIQSEEIWNDVEVLDKSTNTFVNPKDYARLDFLKQPVTLTA